MSLTYDVLGRPGRDNALLVTVDTGQSQHRLLFDCGEGCLDSVPNAHVQEIDAVFFSHFHIDHVAGFDHFLRMNWARPSGPVRIFGPPGTIEVMHHRLRGFTWNLVEGSPGEWIVTEVGAGETRRASLLAREGFADLHPLESPEYGEPVYARGGFRVDAVLLDHGTPCLGYSVREEDRRNVDAVALGEMGLRPGPWLRAIKDPEVSGGHRVELDGRTLSVGELRSQLLTTASGESIAYLTDFFIESEAAEDRLVAFLEGCGTLVCEANHRLADSELAARNYHMTSDDVGRLAARVGPAHLVLFHLSNRYTTEQWTEQLREVQVWFPGAAFPPGWEW